MLPAHERFNEKYLILFLVAISFAARLLGAGSYSLWFDEALNFRIVSNAWNVLWISNYDPTPPLYYSILKAFISPNTSELTMRLPSIIFGTLTVLVFYKICRSFFSKIDSFWASALFCLSVHQIEYSQEARAYATQLFFAVSALYYLIKIVLKPSKNLTNYYLYGLFTLLALYTHNISVFYVVGFNIIFFIHVLKDSEYSKFKSWLLINSIVFLAWLPWPIATVLSGEGNSFNWLKHISFSQFILSTAKSIKVSADPDSVKPWDFIFIVAMVAGLWQAFRTKERNLLLVVFSMSFALLFCVWAVGFYKPVFMNRTIIGSTLIAYLLIAVFLSSTVKRIKIVVFATLFIIHLISYFNFYTERYSENEQWKQAVSKLESIGADKLLVCTQSPSWVLSYYNNSGLEIYFYKESANSFYESEATMLRKIESKENDAFQDLKRKAFQPDETLYFIDSHCSRETRAKFNNMFVMSEVGTENYRRIKIYSARMQ